MPRTGILKGVVLAVIVFVVIYVVVGGLLALRHGFSTRDSPSSMEVIVARTTRKIGHTGASKTQEQPDSEHSGKPSASASTLGGPLCDLPRQ